MKNIESAAKITREYARWLRDECGADTALSLAALEAVTSFEAAAIGAALLDRNEALADVGYRAGGAEFDPRLAALAAALEWNP